MSMAKGQVVIETNVEEEASESEDEVDGEKSKATQTERAVRLEPFGIAFDLEPGIVIRIETPTSELDPDSDTQEQ